MSPQINIRESKLRYSLLKSTQGFTLIEVLVAVIILAFGLVVVVEGMVRTEQAFRISENMVTASQIADERIAESEILVRERNSLSFFSESEKEDRSGKSFEWERKTRPFSHASLMDTTKLNQVDVSVSWNDGSARSNNESFSTLIMNREKQK